MREDVRGDLFALEMLFEKFLSRCLEGCFLQRIDVACAVELKGEGDKGSSWILKSGQCSRHDYTSRELRGSSLM